MEGASNCTEGTAPDLLYRFYLPPTFNDTYGSGCTLSVTGYAAFGFSVVTIASVVFLLNALALAQETGSCDRILVRITCMALNCATISAIVVGKFAPMSYHLAKLAFFIVIVINVTCVVFHGYFTALRQMKRAGYGRSISQADSLGGTRNFAALGTSVGMCVASFFAGLIGVSVTLSTGFPVNDEVVSAFYRLYCFGVAASLTVLSFILMKGLKTLSGFLDDAIAMDETLSKRSKEGMEKLSSILRKIRRQGFLNLVPQSIIPFVLQGIVLPGFWYGELILYMVVSLGGLVIWAALYKFGRQASFSAESLDAMSVSQKNSAKALNLNAIQSSSVEPQDSLEAADNPGFVRPARSPAEHV